MKRRSSLTRYLALSLLASVLLHLGFWMLAEHVHIKAFYEALADLQNKRRIQVSAIDLREILRRRPEQVPLKKRLLDEQERRLRELFEKQELFEKPRTELKPVLAGLGRDIVKPVPRATPEIMAPATSPPPEILAINAKDLPLDRLLMDRPRIPDIDRQPLEGRIVPSLVSRNPTSGGIHTERVPLSMRMSLPPRGGVDVPPPTTPIEAPRLMPDHAGVLDEGDQISSLDRFLKVEVHVQRLENGDGYFQVDIKPNEASEAMRAIPKDVLFVLDSSASITTRKLRQFQHGLELALDYLGPNDRFNLITFKAEPQALFDTLVPPGKAQLQQTREFVSKLRASGKTDVYAGLSPFVTASRRENTERPYLIFLISDGQTTTGHQLENNEFLRRLSHENRADAAIFTFSCGENTNLFLMDFISYKNRGFSAYKPDINTAAQELTSYIGSLSEVLVAGLGCHISGAPQDDIYPRELPDLYRGYPLTVYGHFESGTQQIAIQILGRDYSGKRQELVIQQDLRKAKPADDDLAVRWAGQKLVHLISEQALRPTAERQKEIKQLSERHNIVVPYTP